MPESKDRTQVVGGVNGAIRRLLFPDFPATECINGYVFFPSGTGPTFPIPCDDNPLLSLPGPVGVQFVRSPSSAFVDAVAELAGTTKAKASKAVISAAGLSAKDLGKLTSGELARTIATKALTQLKTVKPIRLDKGATVEEYFKAIGDATRAVDSSKFVDSQAAIKSVAIQTGLRSTELRKLPLADFRQHLDLLGGPPTGPPTAGNTSLSRATGTTICGTSGGTTRCGIISGFGEGILWGAIIGGAIGGATGLGAAIGAVIGGIIGFISDLLS